MCEECGVAEDEYLVESSKDGVILDTKRLCEECFLKSLER